VLFSDEAESEAIGFAVAVGVLCEFFGDGVEFVPVLGRGGDSGLLEEALVVDELDGVSEPGVGVECSVEEAASSGSGRRTPARASTWTLR